MASLILPAAAAAEDDEDKGVGKLTIIGRHERIALADGGTEIDAKVDTGADSSSVHARNIETFDRDDESWVRFELVASEEQTIQMERRVVDDVTIISSGGGRQKRYVVEMDLCLGTIQRTVEVNLADREGLDFRMLIGREYMVDAGLLVNPAQEYSSEPRCDGVVER